MRRPLPLLFAAVLLLGGVATACGGDDAFPRDEFVEQTTASGVKKAVAECAYDEIVDDEAIMKELNRTGGPNPDISEKVSGQLSTILARCLLAAEDDGATASGRSTTTTTRKP